MTQIPPPAEELRLLDAELSWLDARRTQLLGRRAWLVAQLHRSAQVPQPPGAPFAPGSASGPVAPGAAGPFAPRPEASAPGVQNLLLLLGGALLTVAAAAFTLVSWGDLGIAGRAVVLGVVTAAALAVPVPLLRRGLRSTAETVAGLGLALTVLDAYALHAVALADTDGTGYAAVASAVLAAVWAAYGLGLARVAGPGLRLPVPAALGAAQLPLLLAAVAADALPYGITTALLVTAALDTGVALRVSGLTVRVVAATGAYGLGGWGVLAAGWLSWTATGPSAAARAAALLLFAAAIALTAAWRAPTPGLALGLAVAGGALTVPALAGVPRVVLPDSWAVPVHLAFGMALLAALRVPRIPAPVREGLGWASGGVQTLAVVWTLPMVAVALAGPLGWVGSVWEGAPPHPGFVGSGEVPWPADAVAAPLVLVMVAALLPSVVREATWRPRALEVGLGLGWAAVVLVPAVFELPYAAALVLLAVTTAALSALKRIVPVVLAVVTSVSLAFTSLASEPATLTVLAFLTALFALGARRPLPAAVALAYATAFAGAAGASLGLASEWIALPVLLVPVAAALLAPRLPDATGLAVEITGGAAALVAVALAVTDVPVLALVLALCGVIATGTALRPDRRPARYVATALFVLAAWVRLAGWEVTVPEAYTLPVSVPLLLFGLLLRHGDPRMSSWTAYAPGLSVTLVPSLVTAWDDTHWQRPLLLGTAALAVTLVGARHRLQAPLALGGSVLVLVTLHELAPYLVQVAGLMPRWVPPALAGLVLLALGATYEQRLRNVRKVRDALGRMD
ncbi:SCO7613 C-terminal domain-containing membrane protein [Streptomyces sp. NPDC088789]|uniref:SCO7613 C-terminal domain-containing membrane protein n=1 Tax=Streptomyces sp. NPDC088789 TaxID=3365899 RepID=UPI00380DAF9C